MKLSNEEVKRVLNIVWNILDDAECFVESYGSPRKKPISGIIESKKFIEMLLMANDQNKLEIN